MAGQGFFIPALNGCDIYFLNRNAFFFEVVLVRLFHCLVRRKNGERKHLHNKQLKDHRNEKISIRGDGKFPDLKVNDKQSQTANLVYIFDEIKLSVTVTAICNSKANME